MGGKNSKVVPAKAELITLNDSPLLKKYQEQLTEWSSLKKGNIIYDSTIDSKLSKEFYERILNQPNIYIINVDEFGNIFGSYFKKPIDKIDSWMYTSDHFIFSLESNGKFTQPMKWTANVGEEGGIRLYDKDIKKLYEIGNGEFWSGMRFGYFTIADINVKGSCFCNLSFRYEGIKNDDLNGLNGAQNTFIVNRIVVLQMLTEGN
ncbi:TLDc domain-containing protein [Entamoeba marina]